MRSAEGAVGKATLGLCSVKEGLSGYKGCKVYSLSLVLFIIFYLNSYFITSLGLFLHKRFCTVLHLPAPTLSSRAEHPGCPFSILQACTDSHIFTTISTFIQYYDHNSIDLRFYFLMLIFFSIHENHLTDPEHSKHLRHLLNVFFRLQLMRYSICIWEIRDC